MKIVVDAMAAISPPRSTWTAPSTRCANTRIWTSSSSGPAGAWWRRRFRPMTTRRRWTGCSERLTVVDAPEVITTEEHPVMALRRKKNSTFVVGMDIVRRKEAQAFVSAGSTGALMAGAMFKIGRIKGIDRPALATLRRAGAPMLLVDAGANTDCQPKWIVQFAMMGSAYMRRVMNVSDPEVGLLNIGVEAAKGNEQAQAAYALMEKPRRSILSAMSRRAMHWRARRTSSRRMALSATCCSRTPRA